MASAPAAASARSGPQAHGPCSARRSCSRSCGYAELPTQMAHLLAFQQASHETQAFVHDRTLFPRHRHLPMQLHGEGVTHVTGTKRHLCLGSVRAPVSGVSQKNMRAPEQGPRPGSLQQSDGESVPSAIRNRSSRSQTARLWWVRVLSNDAGSSWPSDQNDMGSWHTNTALT